MPAFPILSVSRKPVLLVIFVSAFFFLYQIANHPKVSKQLQPVAYYTDYDEKACLPQKQFINNPPAKKAKAAMVILVRNKEQADIAQTIVNFEDRFNKNFKYPYVFLNEEPFTDEFKEAVKKAAPNADMRFGLVPENHWSYPVWVNKTLAAEKRAEMGRKGVYYGDLESYHHMCRYQSGFFFDHPLLDEFDWYWRVEPGVKYYCDITYDPFLFMEKYKKKYGFVVTLTELPETIPTLWQHVLEYAKTRRIDTSEKSHLLFPYFVNKDTGDFNLCHFWSNFEIASLDLWRSPQYRDFFNYLDKTGNFFYERWGDAPVHSLAAGLFLETLEVHYFEDFGYQHDLYRHCPSPSKDIGCRCECPTGTSDESIDHDQHYDTCLPKWIQHEKEAKKKKSWDVWS